MAKRFIIIIKTLFNIWNLKIIKSQYGIFLLLEYVRTLMYVFDNDISMGEKGVHCTIIFQFEEN